MEALVAKRLSKNVDVQATFLSFGGAGYQQL